MARGGAGCAVGARHGPRLPAERAGVLGGWLRLARARALVERVPSLSGRDRWCPGAFCPRAGPQRPGNPADPDEWLAELLRGDPAAGDAANRPGRVWPRRARLW